jgi:hypothetical protein
MELEKQMISVGLNSILFNKKISKYNVTTHENIGIFERENKQNNKSSVPSHVSLRDRRK